LGRTRLGKTRLEEHAYEEHEVRLTAGKTILDVQDVYKRLEHKHVLRGVSLAVEAGTTVALVGTNGCGKSTLLRVLSGQLTPDAGRVWVCGHELGAIGPDARQHLSYAPDQNEAFLDLNGNEFLRLCYGLRRVERGALELEQERAWGLPEFAGRRMRVLSFGQRKRICIAAALGGAPELLLLDEPTNGIDAAGFEYLTKIVRARRDQGKVTLAATHDANVLAAWQPQVVHLVDGRCHPGAPTFAVDAP
jgi:ABC-2 type transport system ATP-binding protein